jgi:hypothetical protein
MWLPCLLPIATLTKTALALNKTVYIQNGEEKPPLIKAAASSVYIPGAPLSGRLCAPLKSHAVAPPPLLLCRYGKPVWGGGREGGGHHTAGNFTFS